MLNYTVLDESRCEYVPVGDEGEIGNGERFFIQIDDLDLVIFQIAGTYFAIGDVCSHDDGPLGDGAVEGTEVVCPRHGARFDLKSGRALSLPAIVDIPAYPVRISDGQIEVGIPIDA